MDPCNTFCSEFVAVCLDQAGLVPPSALPRKFIPSDVSRLPCYGPMRTLKMWDGAAWQAKELLRVEDHALDLQGVQQVRQRIQSAMQRVGNGRRWHTRAGEDYLLMPAASLGAV